MGYSLCMMAEFQNALCTEQLEMICRMDFDMFFGILIFDPK